MARKEKEEKPVVYSALEVANICGVVNQTAINWVRNEHLKAYRTPGGQYRIYPDDLAEFMRGRNMRVPPEVLESCRKAERPDDKKILIVDDDEGFNTVVAKFLEKKFSGMKIVQAFDGFDAGSKMIAEHPSCVILDLDLPGVDGYSLLKKIKESGMYGRPSVIVVTGNQDSETRKKCYALGVDDFFTKPINLVEIATSITTMTFN